MTTAHRARTGATSRSKSAAAHLDLIELWAVGQYVDGLVRGELRRHGLSGELLALLAQLGRTGPRTIRELSTVLGQAFMTVSDHVSKLERAGEVQRIDHPSDGRSRLVVLTPAGRRRVEDGIPHVRTVIDAIERHLSGDVGVVRAAAADLRGAVQSAFEELEAEEA
jgi:DNA-binding MarR family transcriptional regulator